MERALGSGSVPRRRVFAALREPMRPGDFEYESYSLLQRTGHALERLTPNRRTATFPAWSADRYPDGYSTRAQGGRRVAKFWSV